MGLKCSILGHAFEPTGTETERQEQGSEVVTTVREIEECTRCGKERVVSETTEVTAVVDSEEVDIDEGATTADIDGGAGADSPEGGSEGSAFDGVVDRSMGEEDAEVLDDEEADGTDADAAAAAAVDELAESPDEEEEPAIEDRDPEEEDAEILTDDDEPERDPGEWPDDEDVVAAHEPATDPEDGDAAGADADPASAVESESASDEDRLAGITVPEGTIVCPACDFTVDAESSYRDGDPCPECGAWLVEDGE
ncbi:DUF7093 family protein [Natronomonas amylolytica]|uniref:DUF7093 family protein n=1 Tax=Natronomonas amylolytica TaxID=3108498 RepID=UPI00300862B1